jgi:glycosyltransferase involved in cell wall biosynthesis
MTGVAILHLTDLRMRNPKPLSIAILNPLGDFGINEYCWQFAEALGAAGVAVKFYTSATNTVPRPGHHVCVPVLQQQALFRQQHIDPSYADIRSAPSEQWIPQALAIQPTPVPPSQSSVAVAVPQPLKTSLPLRAVLRKIVLTSELAAYLRFSGIDIVWTQWPDLESYSPWFGSLCQKLGMRYVHTVHNVVPHEHGDRDLRLCERIYRDAELLFVHSQSARQELTERFPETAKKVRVLGIGLYDLYPRFPHRRSVVRAQLGLTDNDHAVLFAGGIRPYKNIDSSLQALRLPGCERLVMIVAGNESAYPDLVPGEPLGRTRRLAAELGVLDRIRLLPRSLSIPELSELLEASDIQLLPYTNVSGSGMIMLGMTFGKYIVASPSGGMDEYLVNYSQHNLLEGPVGPASVAAGLRRAASDLAQFPAIPERLPEFEWSNIALRTVDYLKGYA